MSKIRTTYTAAVRIVWREYGKWQIRRRGFWFVDIPRTSSTSIKAELGRACGRAFAKRNIVEPGFGHEQIFPDHLPARQMRMILGERAWQRIFTFTIVRNPWDRMLSLYFYRRNVVGNIPPEMDFRTYVRRLAERNTDGRDSLFFYHGQYLGAVDYIEDEHRRSLVDFIGRYENRERDLTEIAQRIGLLAMGTLHLQNAGRQSRSYTGHYDEETKDLIARLYRRDIERFGYRFGE